MKSGVEAAILTSILEGAITQKNKWHIREQQGRELDFYSVLNRDWTLNVRPTFIFHSLRGRQGSNMSSSHSSSAYSKAQKNQDSDKEVAHF